VLLCSKGTPPPLQRRGGGVHCKVTDFFVKPLTFLSTAQRISPNTVKALLRLQADIRGDARPREDPPLRTQYVSLQKEFFIDNQLARIHLIIVMTRWTGLALWEFEFPFPGSLTSTLLQADIRRDARPREDSPLRAYCTTLDSSTSSWVRQLEPLTT